MKKSTITKVGITLACATLLGGAVVSAVIPSLSNIVYAEDTIQQPISVSVIAVSAEDDTQLPYYNVTINPGETKIISAPKVEGWKLDQYTAPTYELTYDYALRLMKSAGFAWVQFWMIRDTAPTTNEPVIFTVAHRVVGGDDLLLDNAVVNPGESITLAPIAVDGYVARADNKYTYTYDEVATGSSSLFVAEIFYDKVAVDQPVEKPADQPTEQPAEQPTEQPVDQPADQPVEKPADQPAEVPTEQPAEQPAEQPVEQPTEQPVDQPADQPAEQPVDQPVETPADQPAEQPVDQPTDQPAETPAEQPVDTPTDKPVEQLTDASSLTDQPAGKVQAVTATDKKTVDKSAPSTPAVKPQEVSQPVAKTLPKTGDSSSMLLVLGGVLSGLSGLGLAATSRKRD
ncbi:LPXTG cell wall anchor domain-containing protein [Streptococcus suis]|uniref:LPXTG cell wall anchor domain-containing protein n=1 Tax=Streptococcus suis TaxID=1307 RepID=UPI0004130F68|nr:LPXTG cell wall anchor domain-containing protein [Streptococcus suis]